MCSHRQRSLVVRTGRPGNRTVWFNVRSDRPRSDTGTDTRERGCRLLRCVDHPSGDNERLPQIVSEIPRRRRRMAVQAVRARGEVHRLRCARRECCWCCPPPLWSRTLSAHEPRGGLPSAIRGSHARPYPIARRALDQAVEFSSVSWSVWSVEPRIFFVVAAGNCTVLPRMVAMSSISVRDEANFTDGSHRAEPRQLLV